MHHQTDNLPYSNTFSQKEQNALEITKKTLLFPRPLFLIFIIAKKRKTVHFTIIVAHKK